MRKGINVILVLIMLVCFFAPSFPVKADGAFDVYLENGNSSNYVTSFGSYQEAHAFALAKESESQDNNLVISQNGKIRYVTYGLVNFSADSTTKYTIEFNNLYDGYTHGGYGADAAFLGTNEDGTKVRFKQAGVIGWVDINSVDIVNMNAENYNRVYTNSYIMTWTDTWEFRHNITTDIYSHLKGSKIILGQERPSGMKDNTYYLSYDGHYFYPESLEGYRTMIRDYKNGVYTNSINPTSPYYNYYQFLSHRSITNYTSNNLRQDFSSYTAKPSSYPAPTNESLLFGEETSFIQYQNEYGANAILMLGVAKNESTSGRSALAIRTNNIFSHGAFDSAPGASADRYVSVAQSIFVHSKKFISEGYLDPCDGYTVNGNGNSSNCHLGRYYGGNTGDKASGMNVRYASDPYWGEKAASNYYYFDKQYGLQDYGKYGIGVKTTTASYPIKASPSSGSTTLYTTGNSPSYSVTILSSVTGETLNGSDVWYKIQTDPTLNSSRTGILQDQGAYNFEHNVGYIHSSYLGYVKMGKAEVKRYTINFNPNGGKFSDNITSTKSLTVEEYKIPDINPPSKEGYRFIGWDKAIEAATENVTYTAVYESLVKDYQITFDANGGKFSDGGVRKILTVDAGMLPNIESPNKDGYVFVGWSPVLGIANGNTTYTAQYKKESEIDYKETDGEFYFHELTSDNNGLHIKGYSTINGVHNNATTKVTYEMQFENTDTKEVITIPLNRIMDVKEMPFVLGSMNGYDATYSWFDGTISLDQLKSGNYVAYIITKSGDLFTKKLVRNLLGKTMVGNYEKDGRQVWIRNNYYLKTVPMEFFVRDKVVGSKNNNPIDNMITGYSKIYFEGTELKVRGFAHDVGGNYADNASVFRNIILENTKTLESVSQAISTITDGDYQISLRVDDGYDKTKAWFDGGIDVGALDKGVYVIYISNLANINDFAELNDIFSKEISSKTTINGKNYSLRVNANERYRIELVVE